LAESRLMVVIGAKMDEFNKAMQGVSGKLQSIGGNMTAAGTTLTKGLTVPLLAAGGAVFGLAQKTANMGDEIQKAALRTGFSTEAISELKHAAELSGTSIDSLETGIKRMASTIYDAGQGMGTATDALGSLGLSYEQLSGLSPEEQFVTIAGALADVEDATTRAALAQDLFGRSGTDMLPMLADGSEGLAAMRQEAHELGIVFDQEAADAAAQFNDDLDRLKKAFGGTFQELANKLIPIFVDDLIPALRENLIPIVQTLADKIGELIEWFANLSPEAQKWIGIALGIAVALGPILVIAGMLITAIGAIAGVLSAPVILIGLLIAAIIAVGVAIYNWIQGNEEAKEKLSAAWQAIKDALSGAWDALKELAQVATEAIQAFWEQHGETIMAVLSIVWDQIVNIVTTAINIVKGIIEFVTAIIQGDWSAAWEAIKGIGETVWNFIKTSAENTFKMLQLALQLIWTAIRDKAIEVWENMKQRVIEKANQLYTDARQRLENLWGYIKSIPSQALSWGRDIIQGIWDGIKQKWEDLKSGIKDIVNSIKDAFDPWAKSSPSLIDNIWTGVREIEKAYSSITLPSLEPVSVATGVANSAGGVSGSHVSFDLNGLFAGANITIGSDRDAKALSREIFRLADTRARSEGVMI